MRLPLFHTRVAHYDEFIAIYRHSVIMKVVLLRGVVR